VDGRKEWKQKRTLNLPGCAHKIADIHSLIAIIALHWRWLVRGGVRSLFTVRAPRCFIWPPDHNLIKTGRGTR